MASRVLATLLIAAVGAYVLAPTGDDSDERVIDARAGSRVAVVPGALQGAPPGARLLVRAVDPDAPRADGRLYELTERGLRRAGDLKCKRVHATGSGRGLCLTLSRNALDYAGVVFDRRFRRQRRFAVTGVPDRARVSSDGRYGAFTSFDRAGSTGYFSSSAEFTTLTRIVDMRSGRTLLRLEDLAVSRDGDRMRLDTPQFWGVTFLSGGRFFATLASGREHFLIEGSVGSRDARVVHAGVECPSLSPDGERIAFKSRIGNSNRWRLHVLDLSSGEDTALAETRSIDDQPEWLGDDLVVYSDDRAVFAVAADGEGSPRPIVENATSPVTLAPSTSLARRVSQRPST